MKKIIASSLIVSFILLCFPIVNFSEPNNTKPPRISSYAAVVVDYNSGRVLFQKNSKVIHSIASTTKIMTAIIALEKGNQNDLVTISKKAAGVGGSAIHLMKNEKYRLGDLLYGLMLNSGNDAAIAIAEHVGGSVEGFAKLMNNKAKEIGAKNTQFVTPHGLDTDGHYSTAEDLAKITAYALKNKTLRNIVATKQAEIYSTGNRRLSLRNTNEMLYGYPGADGVKTGFTGKAGRCLVTSAKQNNLSLISVVLGSASRSQRSGDSSKLLNYSFKNFQSTNLNLYINNFENIEVIKGNKRGIVIKIKDCGAYPLSPEEQSNIKVVYDLPDFVYAPIKKDDKIGMATFLLNGKEIKKVDIYADEDIKSLGFDGFLEKIVNQFLMK